jgi:thiamine pyrophosphokinase
VKEPPVTGQAVLCGLWDKARGVEARVRIVIVASGQCPREEDWSLKAPENDRHSRGDWGRWVENSDLVIGADGGAAVAMQHGVLPGLVIGDMDSLREADRALLEAEGVRIVVHPRAKDETDLELALRYAVKEGATEIVVLGALGGRLDHTLSNVLLLALPELEGLSVRIVRSGEEALLLRSGEGVTLSGGPGDLVSLLPVGGTVQGVSTTGLAWGLSSDALEFGQSRGVSNVMLGATARVDVESGTLLVVHSRSEEN